MITYRWVHKCDYCETEVRAEVEFIHYPGSQTVLPQDTPDAEKHGIWQVLDSMLICPDHEISIANTLEPTFPGK